MFIKLYVAIRRWFVGKLKLNRADYIYDDYGRKVDSKIRTWTAKEGLGQMSLVRRWWFMYGRPKLYSILYEYIMSNGVWMGEWNSENVDGSTHYVPWIGKVHINSCNVMDMGQIIFVVLHYRFELEVGEDATFPPKRLIRNWFIETKDFIREKEIKQYGYNLTN